LKDRRGWFVAMFAVCRGNLQHSSEICLAEV
jgi:hypothetical protein